MLIFLCHSIHTSYVVKATFRLYDFMDVRFGWSQGSNIDLYQGLWAQAYLPGAILSSTMCGKLFAMGRRISMYLGTITATIGILFLLIENMWVMIFGKLFIGISMGIIFTVHGRVLEEFTPPHLYDRLFTTFLLLATIADSACIIIAGSWLPEDRDELATTGYWRWYLGFPLIFCAISLVCT